jgi:UDP-N-acetylmuramoyl-L-alanyl-D-glutamate--2,6-diaminopimelate ligase
VLLSQVITGLDALSVAGPTEVDVTHIDHDSRRVGTGSLFCCVPGARVDGHRFAGAAVAAGAPALLVERPVEAAGATQVVVADVRRAMALAAAELAGHPSRQVAVIGVTGTNGKTTTTWMLRSVFEHAGRPCAVLGTLRAPGATGGPPTTPDAPELQRWLADRRDEGIAAVAMEVSSHALAAHRVDGTRFAAAVFTNLTPDHLDFHGSMEAYFDAKTRLFTSDLADQGVVNLDDPYGRRLHLTAGIPVTGYSLTDARDLQVTGTGSTFGWRDQQVRLGLGARFNVANALAAAETALALGIDEATIAAGLSRPLAVPGRFEAVDEGQPFRVIVDYAHTPDGLEQVLAAARELVAGGGRVHVVFGCGGDRDATKRPVMGEVAARLADRVVLTADNSRREETRAIIAAVREGTIHATDAIVRDVVVEPDRDAAIATALADAAPGDLVVIAGKGHETTQTIGDIVTAFDDREVARRHLRALLARPDGRAQPDRRDRGGS